MDSVSSQRKETIDSLNMTWLVKSGLLAIWKNPFLPRKQRLTKKRSKHPAIAFTPEASTQARNRIERGQEGG